MGDAASLPDRMTCSIRLTSNEVERLYREQGGRIWAAVFACARDRTVAEDAVAEAFAQLLRRGGEVHDPSAWVWTAAFRLAAGELKRRRSFVPQIHR